MSVDTESTPTTPIDEENRVVELIHCFLSNPMQNPNGGALSAPLILALLHKVEPVVHRNIRRHQAIRRILARHPDLFWILDSDDHQWLVALAPYGIRNTAAAKLNHMGKHGPENFEHALVYILAQRPNLSATLIDVARWFDGLQPGELVRFIRHRPALFRFQGPLPSALVVLRPLSRLHR